ncbi:trypsin-like serine protease [Martensiomyces pterosporus]|nr:trypsin-like serine protease [Martensiomyces pterosporus]
MGRHRSLDLDAFDGGSHTLLGVNALGRLAQAPSILLDQPLTSRWQQVSEKAANAVVTIRFCQAFPFDTMGAVASEASGFVVDKERGIILTNRHVACAGPFVGEAVFQNREQVNVHAIYRDPIHDFGFLKYSPEDVKYYQVQEIPLDPSKARIGTEIRIIGNDAGEELSILAGQISRVDRNAPDFGPMTYNDFNTFYLQAAASSSGGSSGSPVIDIHGSAIGLQAAGRNQSATDFFLPLDRVKRALELIQQGERAGRGDIQVQFLYEPFDYVRRIGLSQETEAKVRQHDSEEIGMLVIETVLPEGPGDRAGLVTGDVLVSIDGRIVTKFVHVDEIMDSCIGKEVRVLVERDGESVECLVAVEDVDGITPDRFVEMGGAVIHDLSYQLARYYCVPVCGVFVAQVWGMLPLEDAGEGVIIRSVDGHPTHTLDDFVQVIRQVPDRARVPVVYYSLNDIHEEYVHIVENERHWTDMNLYTRNDLTGVWDRQTIDPPPAVCENEEQTARFATSSNPTVQAIIPSLVQVHFYIPWMINAFPVCRRTGTGLVVDAERGLVAISRSIVPFELGDLSLTVAESVTIPAAVVYLHPTLNFAIAQYDPALLGKTQTRSARLSARPVAEGDRLMLHTYNSGKGLANIRAAVSTVEPMSIPKHSPPRFRSINASWFKLDTRVAQKYNTGVLTDYDGVVCGMWVSFVDDSDDEGNNSEYFYGLDACQMLPVLDPLRVGGKPRIRTLGVELTTISLVEARHLGLDRKWISRIEEVCPEHRQLLMISRVACDSRCSGALRPLDVVLTVDGEVATRYPSFDKAFGAAQLKMSVLRNKKVVDVAAETDEEDGTDTRRIIQWSGAIMHEPHKAVSQQCRELPSRTYVSYNAYGSPAYTAGMAPTSFITHVEDMETPDLDAFVEAVSKLSDTTSGFVCVRIVGIDRIPAVISVKVNPHYWPTIELVKDSAEPNGWNRIHYN